MSSERLSESRVMSIATQQGLLAGGITGVASFGLSYFLHHNNPTYRTRFSISAKVGLPIMVTIFAGSVFFELAMFDAHRNPENWDGGDKSVGSKKHTSIPVHHWLMNRIHDRPFYFATALSLPLVAKIIHTRMKEPHLTISQALLQSRVMGQFGILAIVLSIIGVKSYVDSHGRFPEGDE